MPDLKISQLPPASTPLAGTELVPIVQGGVTDQTTVQAILTGTVPSGTANGVLYLNGSKVVTSGSGLTFDGTSVFAAPRVRLNNANRLDWGDTGEWIVGDNGGAMIFGVDTAEQMRLTSTGLGIGTNNPLTKLDVYANGGMVRLSGDSGNNLIQTSTSSGATGIGLWAGGSARLYSTGGMTFSVNSTLGTGSPSGYSDAMTLDSSGNLGIGTNAPSAKLAVSNAGAAGLEISPTSGFLGGAYLQGYNRSTATFIPVEVISSSFAVVLGITQAMTLDASGNLAVGTTNNFPSARIFASGAINTDFSSTIALRYNVSGQTTAYWKGMSGSQIGFGQTARGLSIFNYDQDTNLGIAFYPNAYPGITSPPDPSVRIPATGGMVVGTAALATNATDGFLYVPTCAGQPTGTPTTQTGTAPIVVDTTNNKLYFYSGGAWRDAGP
jgi:hypothetical protein